MGSADACRNDCRPAHCGDGTVDSGEECDDGNYDACDGCAPDCTIETGFVCDPEDPPDLGVQAVAGRWDCLTRVHLEVLGPGVHSVAKEVYWAARRRML